MYNFKKLALVGAMSGAFVAPFTHATDSDPNLTIGNPVVIAEELVEGASTVDLLATGTTININLGEGGSLETPAAPDGDGLAINQGSIFNITFGLTNATFDASLSVTDLDYSGAVGEVSIALVSGGSAGDSTVTYQVSAIQDISDDEDLILNLPALNVSSDTTVEASASITVTNSSGIDDIDEGTVMELVATDDDVISYVSGVDIVTNDGADDALIDVTNRDSISDGGAATDVLEAPVTGLSAGVQALFVGSFAITIDDDGSTTDLDGVTFDVGTGQGGEGVFTVTVTGGAIDDNDIVFIDFDGDNQFDAGEEIAISGGTATASFDSEDLLGDGELGDTSGPVAAPVQNVFIARESLIDLAPATYTLVVSYSADSTSESESSSATATTVFDGLSLRDVFGNYPLAGSDIGNLRVTSASSILGAVNSVFLQVYAMDGTDLGFVELSETIAPAGTINITRDEVLAALGLASYNDDGSVGNRVFVEVWTSDPAIVLPLVSRNGVLTNMSQSTLEQNLGTDLNNF